MTALRTCNPLLLVRSEAQNPNGADHVPPIRRTKTKPSLIVRTESNVRREVKKKPDRPCVSCKGSGKVDCCICEGEGICLCLSDTDTNPPGILLHDIGSVEEKGSTLS